MKRTLSVLFMALLLETIVAGCSNDQGAATPKGKEKKAGGILAGRVLRGPMCPVQTPDRPCPPEPASGVKLVILTQTGQEIRSVLTNDEGRYSVSLPPGTYRVEMGPLRGIEFTPDLPATVSIAEGQEMRKDILIDTGIR
jgi:hypothetical protein